MALRIELERAFSCLASFDSQKSMECKKVGLYMHLKKLIPCYDILWDVSKSNSVQSLITLQRMIVDNYAIFFLLTSHSTNEEQLLRYYLYLLDAVLARPIIIDNFQRGVTHDIPKGIYKKAELAVNSDNIAAENLKLRIKKNQKDIKLSNGIIEKANWKFKIPSVSNQNKNRYSWTELYSIAKIPLHHAKMIQDYNSAYVHGLGMSIFGGYEDKDIFPLKIFTMDFCSVLMSLIIKILTMEFKAEMSEVKFNDNTIIFMNENWSKW